MGGILVLLAWALGLIDEIKSKKNLIELRFSFITLLGVTFLILYSYLIKNFIFLFLNGGIFIMVIFEIAYTIYIKRKRA